jgi:hypothetical protein
MNYTGKYKFNVNFRSHIDGSGLQLKGMERHKGFKRSHTCFLAKFSEYNMKGQVEEK